MQLTVKIIVYLYGLINKLNWRILESVPKITRSVPCLVFHYHWRTVSICRLACEYWCTTLDTVFIWCNLRCWYSWDLLLNLYLFIECKSKECLPQSLWSQTLVFTCDQDLIYFLRDILFIITAAESPRNRQSICYWRPVWWGKTALKSRVMPTQYISYNGVALSHFPVTVSQWVSELKLLRSF